MIIYVESLRETLSKNFMRAVEQSGRSVRDLAAAIGVSETSFHRWKNGTDVPKLENVEAIAKELGVSPSEFYKTDGGVVSITSPRRVLQKYLVIPDEIVEGLCHFSEGDEVWSMVRAAIRIRSEAIAHDPKKNHNGG